MLFRSHPFVIGLAFRIKYLDQALQYICSHDGVWKTTGAEIADYYMANYYDAALARLNQRSGAGK